MKKDVFLTQRPISFWIFATGLKWQILLLIIILITVAARVVPLEMQKKIVNEAISLQKTDLLMRYCGIYLIAVLLATSLKYAINILQTYIGQRALAEMRKSLYQHILTLPLAFFRKTQPGMVVAALVNELAAAGDFVGMAVAVPVTSILTLLAFGGYLFWLNPLLAAVSLSIYPIVLVIVPMLQRKANQANKERVDVTRVLSNNIGESITGIHEIHGNGSYRIETEKYSRVVERLFKVRVRWNLYRYGIKVSNNFFNSLSPFLIFILGGYLTIQGRLELGALVAFLSAQEKLYDPWKELLEYYQSYQDAIVSYRRTMEYFDRLPDHRIEPADGRAKALAGHIDIENLTFSTDGGIVLLDNVSFKLEQGEQLAVVGFSGSGKSTLAHCIAQLYKYTDGHIRIDSREVSDLSKADMARTIGIVSQSPFIFNGTIEENLLYSCRAVSDIAKDGTERLPSLDDRIAALQQAGIFVDVLRFGLNMTLDRSRHPELAERITRVRENFQSEFGETLSDYVEFFNPDQYLNHASISENLLFGTTRDPGFAEKRLTRNRYFLNFLDSADLTRPLMSLGAELARQVVDILGNLPPESVFFEQSPISAEELPDCKALADRLERRRFHQLAEDDRQSLLELALRFAPGRHKMVALASVLKTLILEGRALLRERVAEDYPGAVEFHDPGRYIDSETLLGNILFGRLTSSHPQAQEKINQSIIQLLIAEDLLETVLGIGMQFEVGSKGDKLSGGQRQKLAIARILLKNPNILIMDEATSALDNKSQSRIQNLIDGQWKGRSTVISVAHRLDIIKNYDRVAVMKAGKIGEIGTYEELMAKEGMLYELVYGKK